MNSNNSRNRNNNLNPLDKGWFYVYKVILYIFFALTILGTLSLIYFCFYALINSQGFPPSIGFTFALNMLLIRLFIWQLEAMEKRDLKVAKEALIGFSIYIGLNAVIVLGISLAASGSLATSSVIQFASALAVFVVCVFFGSIKVYLFLKKNQSGSYQNMNHIAP